VEAESLLYDIERASLQPKTAHTFGRDAPRVIALS
jgi:hypothetical protein